MKKKHVTTSKAVPAKIQMPNSPAQDLQFQKTQALHTPSFYSDENEWAQFLALAPNYILLQSKLLAALPKNAKNILDLGSATGDTVFKIAGKLPKASIIASDKRGEILSVAREIAQKRGIANVNFALCDMEQIGFFFSRAKQKFDAITMLYSFHHLKDPVSNKENFAKTLHAHLAKNGIVVVADVCVPVSFGSKKYEEQVRKLWLKRFNYVFKGVHENLYGRLVESGIPKEDAKILAHRAASKAAELEAQAGEFVALRKDEYPVTSKEMKMIFEKAGFEAKLEKANTYGEVVLIAKKA